MKALGQFGLFVLMLAAAGAAGYAFAQTQKEEL